MSAHSALQSDGVRGGHDDLIGSAPLFWAGLSTMGFCVARMMEKKEGRDARMCALAAVLRQSLGKER